MKACAMCGGELQDDSWVVDGVGALHQRCEIRRLEGLLLEARQDAVRLMERVEQLEGHRLPPEFVAVKRLRLAQLEEIERGVKAVLARYADREEDET